MKPYKRTVRVDRAIQELLAIEIERLMDSEERLLNLTVTGVKTSNDLRHADIYFDSLNSNALEALEELRGFLQRIIAKNMRIKRIPRLEFKADPAIAEGLRIESLIKKIHDKST
jgi:ribosome-binding factor A